MRKQLPRRHSKNYAAGTKLIRKFAANKNIHNSTAQNVADAFKAHYASTRMWGWL